MNQKESKYKAQLKKMNRLDKKNSRCREQRDEVSCFSCELYSICNSNNWNDELEKLKKLSEPILERTQLKIRESLKR